MQWEPLKTRSIVCESGVHSITARGTKLYSDQVYERARCCQQCQISKRGAMRAVPGCLLLRGLPVEGAKSESAERGEACPSKCVQYMGLQPLHGA